MQFGSVGVGTYLPKERNDHLDLRHEEAQIRAGGSAENTNMYLKNRIAVFTLEDLLALLASLRLSDPHGRCMASGMLMPKD
jgi:hypothetical protein